MNSRDLKLSSIENQCNLIELKKKIWRQSIKMNIYFSIMLIVCFSFFSVSISFAAKSEIQLLADTAQDFHFKNKDEPFDVLQNLPEKPEELFAGMTGGVLPAIDAQLKRCQTGNCSLHEMRASPRSEINCRYNENAMLTTDCINNASKGGQDPANANL